jgi:hypothetical protein
MPKMPKVPKLPKINVFCHLRNMAGSIKEKLLNFLIKFKEKSR